MILRLLVFLISMKLSVSLDLPEVMTYAKVSKNGQVSGNTSVGPLSWIVKAFSTGNDSTSAVLNEGRGMKDIVITASPIYIPAKSVKLQNGEVVDYSSPKPYSTLNEDLVAKLDARGSRIKAQDRFHPPAVFEHSIAHENALRQKGVSSDASSDSSPDGIPPNPGQSFPKIQFSSPNFDSFGGGFQPSDFSVSKPPDDYRDSKIPDTYMPRPPSYHDDQESDPEQHDAHISDFSSGPIYESDVPPKDIAFTSGNYDNSPHLMDHYHAHDQEIIYDHHPPPDDHFYHDHPTTHPPEMSDQRLNKKPYSYYYIGKKLWYVPLYFSIYFIIYIAALVLKSVARHKINFPAHLAEVAHGDARSTQGEGWWEYSGRILEIIERVAEKFVD